MRITSFFLAFVLLGVIRNVEAASSQVSADSTPGATSRRVPPSAADAWETRLLRQPAVSKDHLAFVYAGDIWVSDRDGQRPLRLTTHPAPEFNPHFSPDGSWIAFSAAYDNKHRRVRHSRRGRTATPPDMASAADFVTGWSSDGKRVLFVSNREVPNSRSGQFYEVPLEGGYERKLMQAVAVEGAWSPDGKRLAYRPYTQAYSGASGWRQHRGGDTPPLWIIDPASGALEELPHVNASDKNPMWVGNDVAFISDRNDSAANLFLYESRIHAVRQLTHETQWDVRNAGVYARTIVFEAGGTVKIARSRQRPGAADPDPPGVAGDPGAAAMEGRRQRNHGGQTLTDWKTRSHHGPRRGFQCSGEGRPGAKSDRDLRMCARLTQSGAMTGNVSPT